NIHARANARPRFSSSKAQVRMSGYILTPTAQGDLVQIRDYYLETAGQRVARQMLVEFVQAFRFLSRNPGAGHKRQDLAENRPVLFWPMRDYLVIYKRDITPLEIVTIARGDRDIPTILGRRGL